MPSYNTSDVGRSQYRNAEVECQLIAIPDQQFIAGSYNSAGSQPQTSTATVEHHLDVLFMAVTCRSDVRHPVQSNSRRSVHGVVGHRLKYTFPSFHLQQPASGFLVSFKLVNIFKTVKNFILLSAQ